MTAFALFVTAFSAVVIVGLWERLERVTRQRDNALVKWWQAEDLLAASAFEPSQTPLFDELATRRLRTDLDEWGQP